MDAGRPPSEGCNDPLHLRHWLGMNRRHSKILFFFLILVAAAALMLPTTAAAGWTWDSADGWTWDGTTTAPDTPAPSVDLPG
jgi:hypothetical protein